jgi:regulator of replication initiation timing
MIKLFEFLFPNRLKIKKLQNEIIKLNTRINSLETEKKQLTMENNSLKDLISPFSPVFLQLSNFKTTLQAVIDVFKYRSYNDKRVLGVPLNECPIVLLQLAQLVTRIKNKGHPLTEGIQTIDTLKSENLNLNNENIRLKMENARLLFPIKLKETLFPLKEEEIVNNKTNSILDLLNKNKPDSFFHNSGGSCSSPL